MNVQPITPQSVSANTFSERIKLLIKRVGSATEIARMCGFSEGVGDTTTNTNDEQYSSEVVSMQRPRAKPGAMSPSLALSPHETGVDAQRLNTAMKILQSELELADSQLTMAETTDMLTDLYSILGPGGNSMDTRAMVQFNHRLTERIREARATA
jgi:hypothetical protein